MRTTILSRPLGFKVRGSAGCTKDIFQELWILTPRPVSRVSAICGETPSPSVGGGLGIGAPDEDSRICIQLATQGCRIVRTALGLSNNSASFCRPKPTRGGFWGMALLLLASVPLAAATGGATYRFDELSGATAIDASGAGNNGSISGASYVAGYAGSASALRFRAGQLDRVVVPQSVFNGFGNTVFFEAMVRPNAYPGICGGSTARATIIRKRAHLNDFELDLLNDGSLSVILYGGDGNALDPRTGPNAIPLNSWTKVAFAYDGTKLIIMVKGQTVATQTGQLTLDWAKNYNTTQIGNNTSDGNCDYSFNGDIDAVTISAFQKKIDEKFTQGFPDTWLPSASASVYNGVLNLNSGCVQLPGTYSRAEGLVIEADVTIMDGGIGDFNIWGLYDDLPACHNGPTNGYYTGWYPAGSDNSQDLIINRTNGASQVLASTSTRISAGTLYRIKQEFLPDGTINTYIDGVKAMTAKNNSRTTGFITLRSWQIVQIDNIIVYSRPPQILLMSFFDSFGMNSLDGSRFKHWRKTGEQDDKTPGCTKADQMEGNIFCSNNIEQTADGTVKLSGQVQNHERRGAGLDYGGPALPLTGTFAARIKFSRTDEDEDKYASIKAFFTYRNAKLTGASEDVPCEHMEHDFEVLTGRSKLYRQQGWLGPFNSDLTQPYLDKMNLYGWGTISSAWPTLAQRTWRGPVIITNVTHPVAAKDTCLFTTEVLDLQTTSGDAFYSESKPQSKVPFRKNVNTLLGANEGYLTLVLTLECVLDCPSDEPTYAATYWAGVDEKNYTRLLTTRTKHKVRALPDLQPLFNLWWLSPPELKKDLSPPFDLYWLDPKGQKNFLLPNSALQTMEIKWFYWHRDKLSFTDVHGQGERCDGKDAVGPRFSGGCEVTQ